MTDLSEKGNLLDKVNSPADLKTLSLEDLRDLAEEIRRKIVETTSKTGGHLAPSLGTVELTIALHYVFDAPLDKIIWDVGHQAYAHKLITGRRDRFHTLRTYGGISGFPKRSESPYDTFDTGHSSTSISAGLGISTAKELKGEKRKVISVIGDGSMTAGMAFEGLNQAGHTEKDLIVVLNDNAMSIAPNVGAFSSFISRKMTGKRFVNLKRDLENFIKSLPGVGENILNFARKSEDSFITFFTPGMMFEAFKFQYVGPIDGHRLDRLIETFNNTCHLEGPILVHVLTVKGKGYEFAEKDPAHYHGVGSFEIPTGVPSERRARGSAVLYKGIRRHHGGPCERRPEALCHYGGHARRNRPIRICKDLPGKISGCGYSGTARGYFCGRSCHGGLQAGGNHLFHVFATGL